MFVENLSGVEGVEGVAYVCRVNTWTNGLNGLSKSLIICLSKNPFNPLF